MPAFLMNYPLFRAVTVTGAPLVGGRLYTYEAGTSNPKATYTDSSATSANANPVILDSRGEARIWLLDADKYKIVLKDASDVQLWEIDDVQGIGSGSGTGGTTQASEWLVQGDAPTYISPTQFSVVGDLTSIYHVGRRVRAQVSGGVSYSTITASSFGGGITTVTVENDLLTLDAGISQVSVGINSADNPSIHVSAVRGALATANQPGDIKMFAGSTPESGWVWCDGTAYDSVADPVTYGALYAVIGNTFGGTDGTNFEVPDLRGRSPMGFGQGDTAEGGGSGTGRSIGDKDGAETHTLTEAELASHDHAYPQLATNASPTGSFPARGDIQSLGATTANRGDDQPHNNVSPATVVGFLIKL